MVTYSEIQSRLVGVGLAADSKYQFLLGAAGFQITKNDKDQLEDIGRVTASFLRDVRSWYDREKIRKGGSREAAQLESGVPSEYVQLAKCSAGVLPVTMMVDTVWTNLGWRVVEVDVTNRNAMGYPLVMRHLFDLPRLWIGIDQAWRENGWGGVTQIMADHHRFYEPYFRFFLQQIGGQLVTEAQLPQWITDRSLVELSLLDLPIMFHSKDHLARLVEMAALARIAIPPVHALSSKAVMALPWEIDEFSGNDMKTCLPETHLLRRSFTPPDRDFFVKLLQSGGAHGTFYNDRGQLTGFALDRRPRAVWQEALPIARRKISYLTSEDQMVTEERYVRVSIFITPNGEVVDADATALNDHIVHGNRHSILTVPVL